MDNTFFVSDELGNEIEMQLLFTFDNDGSSYAVYLDPKNQNGEVFASKYDDDNNLIPIEDPEEWDMVEEVLGAFEDEQDEKEA
ncbi:MAG: DUF1292 domain-containing protein [Erysipelothrix sp.]|nr:DUF1292 domain-containing protein [Erysipelothrix sp.]